MIFLYFNSDPKQGKKETKNYPWVICGEKYEDTPLHRAMDKFKICGGAECRHNRVIELSQSEKIKPRSVKRAKQERDYSCVREKFLLKNPDCERCQNVATEVHHKKGREGNLLCDTTYFMATCRECHIWIENNPLQAKREDWSLNRG